MVYIFEIAYPGTWLISSDRGWGNKVESAIRDLESPLIDAALALSMFEAERSRPFHPPSSEDWERDSARRQQIEADVAQHLGVDRYSWEDYERIRTAADLVLKREKWSAGQLPRSYESRLVFLHARSYLFALDRIYKALAVFSKVEDVPEAVKDASQRMSDLVPHLKGIRDSVAHHEDRSRGLGRYSKPLDLKPIQNDLIDAPHGGALVLENLVDNRFGSIMEDGHYGEVEISPVVLCGVRDILQGIIDSFEWRGPQRHEPN